MSGTQLDLEIRDCIAAYAAEDMTLEAFEDWFLEETWQAQDPVAADLIATVELRIAEFTGGYLDEDELRSVLWGLAVGYTTVATWPGPTRRQPVIWRTPGSTVHHDPTPTAAGA